MWDLTYIINKWKINKQTNKIAKMMFESSQILSDCIEFIVSGIFWTGELLVLTNKEECNLCEFIYCLVLLNMSKYMLHICYAAHLGQYYKKEISVRFNSFII